MINKELNQHFLLWDDFFILSVLDVCCKQLSKLLILVFNITSGDVLGDLVVAFIGMVCFYCNPPIPAVDGSKSIQYINGMNSLNSTSSVTYSDVEARWELIWINWTTVRRSDPWWEFQITIWRTVHRFSCFSLNFTIRYLNCKPKYFYFIAFIVLSVQYAHSFDITPTKLII